MTGRIGSTTVKVVVLDEQNKLLFRSYERHYSKTRERACETLHSITGLLAGKQVKMVITGSAGLGWHKPPPPPVKEAPPPREKHTPQPNRSVKRGGGKRKQSLRIDFEKEVYPTPPPTNTKTPKTDPYIERGGEKKSSSSAVRWRSG